MLSGITVNKAGFLKDVTYVGCDEWNLQIHEKLWSITV